jgi:hypothetical protein
VDSLEEETLVPIRTRFAHSFSPVGDVTMSRGLRNHGAFVVAAAAVAMNCSCWLGLPVDIFNFLEIHGRLVDQASGVPLRRQLLSATILQNGVPYGDDHGSTQDEDEDRTDADGIFELWFSSVGGLSSPPSPPRPDELLLRIARSVDAAEEGAEPETCEVEVVVSFADPSTYEASFFDDDPGHPVWQILEPIPVPACGED